MLIQPLVRSGRLLILTLVSAIAVGSLAPAIGQPTEPLRGSWQLVAWDDRGVDGGEDPPTLTFENRRLSGFSGCNRYMGSFSVTGDRLSIGSLGSTRRACDPATMARESRYLAALGAVESYDLDEHGQLWLTYREGSDRIVLVFGPGPVRGLW